MSEPKFKPDSWHTVIEDASYIKIIRIVNATGTLIANVFPSKFKPNIINANLMAAAPDMYEALELVCEDCREGGIRNCVACAVGKAKRKATGESEVDK